MTPVTRGDKFTRAGDRTNTEVSGRRATIDCRFGPDGTTVGKMTVVQRNAKWYLAGY